MNSPSQIRRVANTCGQTSIKPGESFSDLNMNFCQSIMKQVVILISLKDG